MRQRTTQSGNYETQTIRTDDFQSFARDVRRADGVITDSAPVSDGYRVVVFWRD